MAVTTAALPSEIANRKLLTLEGIEEVTGVKTFTADPVFNDNAISWPKINKTGAALAEFAGGISFNQLPSGGGNWVAQPTILGDLTLGSDLLPNIPNAGTIGSPTVPFRKIHATELEVQTLVQESIIATRGRRFIIPKNSTILAADIDAADTIFSAEHNTLSIGDIVFLQNGTSTEWMLITTSASGGGPYNYNITRNLDLTGANSWSAGDAIINTGNIGTGLIDIAALTGLFGEIGPAIYGRTRTGTNHDDIPVRWVIGNLNGTYDYVADIFGAAFGDPAGNWLSIDENQIRIGNGLDILLSAIGGTLSLEGSIFINPITAGGGGTYSNDAALRWSSDLDLRTAIWKSHDSGVAALRQWNFEHVPDGITSELNIVNDQYSGAFAGGNHRKGAMRFRGQANSAEWSIELSDPFWEAAFPPSTYFRSFIDLHKIGGSSTSAGLKLGVGRKSPASTPGTGEVTCGLDINSVNLNLVGIIGSTTQLRCKAYNNAAHSIPDNVATAAPLNTEDYDVGAMHDNAVNNTRITIPALGGGLYFIKAKTFFSTPAAATVTFSIRIRKNGIATELAQDTKPGSPSTGLSVEASTLEVLAGGDYVEAYIVQTTGAAYNVGSAIAGFRTTFEVVKVW